MKDITMYSNEELSLIFLNDEYYYTELLRAVKHGCFDDIYNLVDIDFIYDPEQLADLQETFDNEVEEYNQE